MRHHSAAQKELDNQRRINQQMLAVQREQMELEKKAQEIQARIDAIKRLRESQQGPSAVLHEIKARFDAVPGSLPEEALNRKTGKLRSKVNHQTSIRLPSLDRALSSRTACLAI